MELVVLDEPRPGLSVARSAFASAPLVPAVGHTPTTVPGALPAVPFELVPTVPVEVSPAMPAGDAPPAPVIVPVVPPRPGSSPAPFPRRVFESHPPASETANRKKPARATVGVTVLMALPSTVLRVPPCADSYGTSNAAARLRPTVSGRRACAEARP